MHRRLGFILVLLALVLAGTGSGHAVHFATEHRGQDSHGPGSHAGISDAHLPPCDGAPGHPHSPHQQHTQHECLTCQMLAGLSLVLAHGPVAVPIVALPASPVLVIAAAPPTVESTRGLRARAPPAPL